MNFDLLSGLGNAFSSLMGSGATGLGGLQSLLGNQGRMDQGSDLMNAFYTQGNQNNPYPGTPGQPRLGGGWTGGNTPAGPGSQYNDFLRSQIQEYAPGGTQDPRKVQAGLTTNAQNLYDSLAPFYKNRWDRGMDYLKGAGEQERKDINTGFNNTQTANQAELASRGLAGTTITPTLTSGNERNRSDALGGLNERIRNQYLNTDASLSGDYANAIAQLSGNLSNAGVQAYGLGSGAQNNLLQLQQGLYGNQQDELFSRLNWLTNVQNPYPSQDRNTQLGFQSGMGSWPAPSLPRQSSGSSFMQGMLPGLAGAALLL